MQNDYTKMKNISLSVLLTAIILTLLRTAILLFGFDFEAAFFINDTPAYVVYGLFIISAIVYYSLGRGLQTNLVTSNQSKAREAVLALATAVFLALTVLYIIKLSEYAATSPDTRNLLKTVSYAICLPTAILSAIYYFMRLFAKLNKSGALSLLALCPVIFLSSLLLERFATVSASASSLSHFPDIISLLILAFFMLNEGKGFIPNYDVKKSRLSSLFIVFIALTFSAIPDLIAIAAPSNALYFEDVCYLLLKLVFIAYAIIEAQLFTKSLKEAEK